MKLPMVAVVVVAACSEPRTRPGTCTTDCAARVHPPGILDPASDDFHPKELARDGWDLNLCASCHGGDFAGGAAGVSCLSCHAAGPTACVTCHGPGALDEPSGNHAPHLAVSVGCAECHAVPASWDAPGHILNTPPPARVTFGRLANLTPSRSARSGPASWNGTTCTNVYCHGDVTPYFGGAETEPRWDEQPPRFTCDRCHGAPPPDHQRLDCVSCHPPLPNEHVDGVIEVF